MQICGEINRTAMSERSIFLDFTYDMQKINHKCEADSSKTVF